MKQGILPHKEKQSNLNYKEITKNQLGFDIDQCPFWGHVNFYGELLILHSKNSDVKFIIYRVFFARRFTSTF